MNVGIILPHLGPSQLTEEVLLACAKGKNSYSLYFENVLEPYVHIPYPTMNVTESLFFRGRIIATTLFSAQYIVSSLNKIEPILYAYDLEWLRGKTDFLQNISIYRNPDLKIYTRSEDYAQILSNYANRPVEVKSLEELINGD